MRGPRAASIALAISLVWPGVGAAPISPRIASAPRAEPCASDDPLAIDLRCGAPMLDLGGASILDASPRAALPPRPSPLFASPGAQAAQAAMVPEPAPFALVLAGLAALGARRRAR